MELFYKGTGAVLLAVVLILTVGKQERDLALVLSMAACCLCAGAAVRLLWPVVEFLTELEQTANLNSALLKNLLKIVGIGLVTEIAVLVCQDGGNASLGKSLQFLGTAAMLQLSLPIFSGMLELIREILGEL